MSTATQRLRRRLPSAPSYRLPRDFVFGAATSAYQVEGAVDQDGRGPSIWEPFLSTPKNPPYDSAEVACDHYNRYREDVALMRQLNLKAYRFSIAWPRILPNGDGKVNEAGLDFYDRLVDELLANDIEPYVTLFHWDSPLSLQKRCQGWYGRQMAHKFADYSCVMVKRLGDRVKKWATLNEPEVIIAGYTGDGMAPAINRPDSAYRVGHHLLLGHALSIQAMRAARGGIECGIVLNLVPVEPIDEAALSAARQRWVMSFSWYLDALLKGYYPEAVVNDLERRRVVKPLDMSLIAQSLDFLGINYYTRFLANAEGKLVEPPAVRTQMGWEIVPSALSKMLIELNDKYELPPVFVTENGAALDDTVDSDGRIRDHGRIAYLDSHLKALSAAIASGVDVRGYFVWSLMDNLEWPLGYKKTFGLLHVNRATLERTIKDSGRWYSRVIAKNCR
ncbi:MAG: beta-glucosidase [Bryobacteraceae bacterium]|nr:beta-glucosidase [Bryobacteraceae bacterium]